MTKGKGNKISGSSVYIIIYYVNKCTLPVCSSLAKCLGALSVAEALFEEYKKRPILSRLITDKQCIDTISRYLGIAMLDTCRTDGLGILNFR